MKKLQMIAVLILSLLFVVSCIPDDDDEFWDEDLTDTMSGGNSGGDSSDTYDEDLPDASSTDTSDTVPANDTDQVDSGNDSETPVSDDDVQPAPDSDTTPVPDNDTETPDSDTTPAPDNDTETPDNDTTPATDNDTETPDSDTTPATDNDMETPDNDTTPPAPTEEEKCQTAGGTYANNTCTKETDCSGLPANADWNGNGKFTQTLNGTTWTPASKAAAYGEEGECSFKCTGTYLWNTTECVNDPCNPDPCPDKGGVSGSCTATEDAFTCTCEAEHHWENTECASDSRTEPCTKPDHSHWNEGAETSVDQAWNSDTKKWEPSEEGKYDPDRTDGCYFSCDEKYHWVEETGKCAPNIPECSKENSNKSACIAPNGYIWSALFYENGYLAVKDFTKAKERCDTMVTPVNGESVTWRLPTITELRTLIRNCDATKYPGGTAQCASEFDCYNYSCAHNGCGAGDHSLFGDDKKLWSSTKMGGTDFWVVDFNTAGISSENPGLSFYSRCIYVPEN